VKLPILAAACALAVAPLAACSVTEDNDSGKNASNKISVTSTDDKCDVSSTDAESGTISFSVKNSGDKVTEFYLYGDDGLRIVGEVENVGPGITRDLVLTAQPGKYFTACKPGMVGKGIRADFTVADSGKDTSIKGVDAATIEAALAQYSSYVKDQTSQLVPLTSEFVAAYKAGDDDKARTLFPQARMHWEGVETVAESFGDLDPKTDLRERDLEPGQKWTGWHAIEKDLWPPAKGYQAFTDAERVTYADDLMANINTLNTRVQDLKYTVDQIANGSKGLLDEVATGKITGEEDIWSHTDLWDFQANVDGAKVGYETLKPLLEVKDAALSTEIGTRFEALQTLLDKYKDGDGFVFYDTVTEPQRRELSAAVDALAEPLSKMAGALTL
jgi:iron uptake system component EfeO